MRISAEAAALAPEARRQETRSLLNAILSLGVPIALQNLIGSSLNMLDSVMIGSLGTAEIAGVALANQVFFILNLFLFGVGSGAGVFVAQYWGSRDIPGIRRSLGVCLLLAAAGAVIFFAAAQAAPAALIALFSSDPVVIDYGARFLRIVSIGFLFQAVSISFVCVLRAVERTRLALAASAISLALNTFLNWVLIFGRLGLPALGVEGSAIATVIARFLELVILLAVTYGRRAGGRQPAAARLAELLAFDVRFLRRYLAVSVPVVANEVGWAMAMAAEAVVFGHMGTDKVAAFNIADTAIKLVVVVFFGIVTTSAIIVGKRIGEGDPPAAVRAAGFYARTAPAMGAVLGAALIGLSFLVPSFFNVSAEAKSWAWIGMILFGANMPLRMLNWVIIVGILRAGGDTTYSFVMDIGTTWAVGVPLAAVAGLLLRAPFWVVYLCTLSEDVPKMVFCLLRMRSRRWLNDLTRGR